MLPTGGGLLQPLPPPLRPAAPQSRRPPRSRRAWAVSSLTASCILGLVSQPPFSPLPPLTTVIWISAACVPTATNTRVAPLDYKAAPPGLFFQLPLGPSPRVRPRKSPVRHPSAPPPRLRSSTSSAIFMFEKETKPFLSPSPLSKHIDAESISTAAYRRHPPPRRPHRPQSPSGRP
jgi:hypothetical protein